jgi:transketolase
MAMEFNQLNARFLSKLGHRSAFATAVIELAARLPNLSVFTADMAFLTGLERFKNAHPDKFYNMGIAEQNMIGVAAGMAKEGFVVFATTYATFITMRSYEQIRMNLGYMGFNVKVVGTGAGLAMGMSGNAHYGIEDMALMRALPGMVVVSPCDGMEIIKAVFAAAEHQGPVYLRLAGAMNSPIVHRADYSFEMGKALRLREGRDVTVIATGTMVHESLEAAKLLEGDGIATAVVNMHTIKPLDTNAVARACAESALLVTAEEHSVIGGLGGAVAEFKATLDQTPPQLFVGIPDRFCRVGEYKYLLKKCGLTASDIAARIRAALARTLAQA